VSAKHASEITAEQLGTARQIASNFYEPRKAWPAALAAKSFRGEAKRLRAQSRQSEQRLIGGIPVVWRFVARMLDEQANFLTAATEDSND